MAYSPIGVAPLVNSMGIYDFNNMSLLSLVLKMTKGVFIDIGANIGSYTLVASEVKDAKVISIEPHSKTFERLIENITINGRENVYPMNVAISSQSAEIILVENSIDSTKNRVIEIDESMCRHNCTKVAGKSLDDLCGELEIRPTLIKIDVEGHEAEVLKGFKKEHGSVQMMIIENGDNIKIKERLRDMGFLGPLYMHFKKKKILPLPHRVNEDPIYIRENFHSVLERSRIAIQF